MLIQFILTSSFLQIVEYVREGAGIDGKSIRWFVVQNPGPQASSQVNKAAEESDTLSRTPWLDIPQQQRGTISLRLYLGRLLERRIREAFPSLQDTVKDLLRKESAHLTTLGDPRPNHNDRVAYLRAIAGQYEDLAKKSLKEPGELPDDTMKLRGIVQRARDNFAQNMRQNGHHYPFLSVEQPVARATLDLDLDSDTESHTFREVNGPLLAIPHISLTPRL